MACQAENDADIDRLNETSHYAEAADFERHRLLLPWRVSHILLPPDAIFPYLVEVRFGDTVSLRDLTFDNSLISASGGSTAGCAEEGVVHTQVCLTAGSCPLDDPLQMTRRLSNSTPGATLCY
ncbi:uncharacterized protein DS421_11g326320 [Arachis hypogaea]|nr:uncharacterized protein DS421_11g326320 [Arachis hypogaea]